MNFKVKVNASEALNICSKDLSNLDAVKISDTAYHILYNNTSYHAQIADSNFLDKSYKVIVNNNTFNINIFNDLDLLIKDMGFSLGSTKHIDFIKAPMPGLILEINIKVGQEVKEDDPLLILEAMKMENVLSSPRQGIIKYIAVKKGDAVDKNALLIEFE